MSPLPAIWTAIALAGVAVSVYGLIDIRRDSLAMAGRNGVFRMMTTTRYRREVVRLVSLIGLAVAGVAATIPGTNDTERVVIYVGLFAGTAGMVLNSLLEHVDRALIRRM